MNRRRVINICFTAAVTVVFALLGIFVFRSSYLRTAESFGDLWGSVTYYFGEIFAAGNSVPPPVTGYSKALKWEILLPADFAGFGAQAAKYLSLLFNGSNFLAWGKSLGESLGVAAKVIAIALPCLLAVIVAIRRLYASGNNRHNKDTLPLKNIQSRNGKDVSAD